MRKRKSNFHRKHIKIYLFPSILWYDTNKNNKFFSSSTILSILTSFVLHGNIDSSVTVVTVTVTATVTAMRLRLRKRIEFFSRLTTNLFTAHLIHIPALPNKLWITRKDYEKKNERWNAIFFFLLIHNKM